MKKTKSTPTAPANCICYLAGAGPGDLGLVTLRVRELFEVADVVVFDYLCNPELLKWAKPEAEIICVGKRAGQHKLPQDEINALIVAKTRAGNRVLRLKGGDPFLFGRGGEEAEALALAGLPFEIVPGVTSALAAPAYAGIPVTHRDFASALAIFTGHEDPSKEDGSVDYDRIASFPGTKIMLMGVERLEAITRKLEEKGLSPQTPVALVRWGTTGKQETITGVLSDISAKAQAVDFKAPAVAVFGEVVTLREKLSWFEKRPLCGKRIVVTRSRQQIGGLSGELRELGADVLELPTIRMEQPSDLKSFGELVQDVHQYDWLMFTSQNGVAAFFEMFYKIYNDARAIGGIRIAAVGSSTARKVRDYHFAVDLQPSEYVAEAMIEEFQKTYGSVENQRILWVRGELGRDVLPKELSRLGAIVDEAIAYRTVPETEDPFGGIDRFKAEGADMITFTSSSTVENFMALKLPIPEGLKTASIGPITSQTMRALGLRVDVEAAKSNISGLMDAIREYYGV
ncbi:MAG: uroporphyrinogen-III C-methyltransferase [Verrucomicrobiota bacterium]